MMRIILIHTKKSETANKLLWSLLDAEAKRLALDWHDKQNGNIFIFILQLLFLLFIYYILVQNI